MTRPGKLKLALIFAAVLAASAIRAQNSANPASAAALTFDVASIRENNISTDGHHHIYNDPSVSHFRTINLSVDAQLHALPTEQATHQKLLMVQALLADRFHLSTHQETRQLPVFALVVAKGGPKFKPSDLDGTSIGTSTGTAGSRIHVQGSDNTIALLAREIAQQLGRVVVDKTGINARYDLTLRWTPDDRPAPMLNGTPDPNAPPDIFTAIQEQLGLKLVSTKGPVSVLVIDHIERPTPN